MSRLMRPGWARWSIPTVPKESPTATGKTMVSPLGSPVAWKRAPSPASTLSGTSCAAELLTVTVASVGTSRAASSAVRIGFLRSATTASFVDCG